MVTQSSGDPQVSDRPRRVDPVPLVELAERCGGTLTGSAGAVTGVTLRAQAVRPGDLFAALSGTRTHGARFAADAVAAGAVAVLTDPAGRRLIEEAGIDAALAILEHPDPRGVLGALSSRIYGDPSEGLSLIGITGTSGKTTTAYLVEAALREAGHTVGLIGTVETRIDGHRLPSSLTTPEAPDLQALLAAMREAGVDVVVMEVSSHALDLGRVDGTSFAVGAFTNLSRDHLDYHLTMEAYFEAKARLFAADSPVRARRAVICVDDDWGRRMADIAAAAPAASVVTVAGDGGVADWVAGEPEVTGADGGQEVELIDPAGATHRLRLPLPGRYNVANALVAVAVADTFGQPAETTFAGIEKVGVPGRLERVAAGQKFLAVVDYAHKPAAVGAVLATLRGQTAGRIAVVLGAGGDRDREKRELMGQAAAEGAELVIVTDDNPRSEPPETIRAAVRAGAEAVPADQRPDGAEPVREVGDRAAAIAEAVAWAQPADVVLVAGKGHETGQEVDGVIHPFDDRQVLGAALAERFGNTSTVGGQA